MQAVRFVALATLMTLTGCGTVYYGTLEQFGIEKREILIDRIEATLAAQKEGQQQFSSALEQFQSVVNFDGSDLEVVYRDLESEYDASVAAAEKIRDRISAVESVADALFTEWQTELDEYTNVNLRKDSERQLTQTQRRYRKLMVSMQKAEKTMDPVLSSLKDNVLYLKHNLNARAITSLKGELGNVNADVSNLIKAMQKAIDESNNFIVKLRQGTGA
jgi:hypothetical protein